MLFFLIKNEWKKSRVFVLTQLCLKLSGYTELILKGETEKYSTRIDLAEKYLLGTNSLAYLGTKSMTKKIQYHEMHSFIMELNILDTNAGKQLSEAATDV
jgi:hypothetical protein